MDKVLLRKAILAKRDSIPPVVKKSKDKEIEERLFLLTEFKTAKTIFFFASFRSEVDTFGMIRMSLEAGKRVLLPRVQGQDIGLYEIKGLDELVPGYMKIPEPSVLTDDRKVTINDVDAIIIPGAAYDEAGNRIGYGGGFYDRLLAQIQRPVPVIAPTYEEQVIDSVPAEPHDRKVSIIITDSREIRLI
ncbi:MAG: 5-formyltetrahydrofolate cyclo-ligase [Nitrospirota bacterium]|nr:5-formyltetrahydrofolate cyclo-ligase [Nitrospirota bacterium]